MDKMLQKLVDQGFMKEEFGDLIESAIDNKSTIIASGHKGWGILPLLASVGACVKSKHSLKQVKTAEDLDAEADYFLIGDLKSVDFEELLEKAFSKPGASVITIKDPDHPYSINKVLKKVFKNTGDSSKTYQVLECAKENDEKKLAKISNISLDEAGKIVKEDIL